METERLPRQLAAVLYADVVGFSRMTEADEETTFRNVRDSLDDFAQTIESYQGRVIKYAGDAVLAMFNSATDALICAATVQENMKERNRYLADDSKVCFRIGLNLGDIIQDRGDIFGDGVNVAARLEALSQPNGICVSGSFYDAVAMKLPFDFEFMGEQQVKNINKPIRAYMAIKQEDVELPLPHRFEETAHTGRKRKSYAGLLMVVGISIVLGLLIWMIFRSNEGDLVQSDGQTQKTEIAAPALKTLIVMPFNDLSNDSDQGYFVDGITEDLITDLSRLSGLQVMARNTSFRYKDQEISPKQIGKELSVTHLLVGSVRKAGSKLRINAQLVGATDDHPVWAERYDRNLTDIFAVQDDVTRKIVSALALHLTEQDKTALSHTDTSNFEAYELFLRGQQLYVQREKQANLLAQESYKQAIMLDPSYARSYGALAVTISYAVNTGWSEMPVQDRDRALELAEKAVSLNEQSQHTFWALSYTHLFRREYEQAAAAARRSVEISPSYADGYALLAFIYNYMGKNDEAIELINKAIPLNPHYTFDYPWNLGFSYYMKGEYTKALEYLDKALSRNQNALNVRLIMAASYVASGMQDDAEWEVEQILVQNPLVSLTYVTKEFPLADKEDMEGFLNHLRQAGLPE
jgi:TolB-like protein/class 3 adenylate cyclase